MGKLCPCLTELTYYYNFKFPKRYFIRTFRVFHSKQKEVFAIFEVYELNRLNENRIINDIKNVIECEQIMDDEDIN